MNCLQIQEALSAFCDDELTDEMRSRVSKHLGRCPDCTGELTAFEKVSEIARTLDSPVPPDHLWSNLEKELDCQTVGIQPASGKSLIAHRRPVKNATSLTLRRWALAATVLIAVGMGWLVYQRLTQHGHDSLAVDFSHYLEEFAESPGNAQQILLAKYDGRPITFQEANNVLGYEPLAAKGLPPGYSVDQVYLLKMPCCTCAQVVCKNSAGDSIAIFEHDIEQPVWFGDRPAIECTCEGVPTGVTQIGDRLAATWKEGARYVTIVGASDLGDVTGFVAHFKGSRSGEG